MDNKYVFHSRKLVETSIHQVVAAEAHVLYCFVLGNSLYFLDSLWFYAHTHSSFLFPLHLIKIEIEDYFLSGIHTCCPSDIKLFHVEAVNGSSNSTPWLASSCSRSLISLLSLCQISELYCHDDVHNLFPVVKRVSKSIAELQTEKSPPFRSTVYA